VKSLAYIDLSGDNGGIVLNVGEGGLAVHSAVELCPQTFPRLQFQLPHSRGWIEARGQIAWIAKTKKHAGIQFVELSEHARKQIRAWIAAQSPAGESAASGGREPQARLAMSPPDHANQRSKAPLRELRPAPVGDNQALDRGSRLRYERPGIRGRMARGPRVWRALVAGMCLLATLSFLLGLSTNRNKLANFLSTITRGTQHSPNAVSSATGPVAPAALSGAQTQAARVTVTSQLWIPVPYAQAPSVAPSSLQIGRVEHRVDPEYPAQAIRQGIEGTVQLRASISAAGMVHSIAVVSGPRQLAPVAVKAVRSWRYTPTLLDGKPIGTEADIAIVFWLPADSVSDAHQN
jgi:TonB family protein